MTATMAARLAKVSLYHEDDAGFGAWTGVVIGMYICGCGTGGGGDATGTGCFLHSFSISWITPATNGSSSVGAMPDVALFGS